MYYHVRVTRKSDRRSTVKLDLTEEQLEDRVVSAHRAGLPFMLDGKQHDWDDIESIRITRTEESSEVLRPSVKAEQERKRRASSVVSIGGPSMDWYIADSGVDITDDVFTRPPGSQAEDLSPVPDVLDEPQVDPRNVMVVHGRNKKLSDAMFSFLRALGLNPMEWSVLRDGTMKASPYIGEILHHAFKTAQAVVVLITGDDEARLRDELRGDNEPDHETTLTPQGRPNVLFEAGMALASHPDRTVIVEVGPLRPFSDVAGRHVVKMTNDAGDRVDIAHRLQTAGCSVNLKGEAWLTEGDFTA